MLLCDAHVEAPVAEPLAERQEAGGVRHGGRDGHHLGPRLGSLEERLGEGRRVTTRLDASRVVHVLDGVLLCRPVASALLGQHMD